MHNSSAIIVTMSPPQQLSLPGPLCVCVKLASEHNVQSNPPTANLCTQHSLLAVNYLEKGGVGIFREWDWLWGNGCVVVVVIVRIDWGGGSERKEGRKEGSEVKEWENDYVKWNIWMYTWILLALLTTYLPILSLCNKNVSFLLQWFRY